MRIGQLVLTFFPLLFGVVHAWHNVTYNSNDPALIYGPTRWTNWPAAGCLSWPIGQWRTTPGTITLYFEGVAVYAYGLFDDSTNPIYTLKVDEDTPTSLGTIAPTYANRCDPLYSKTEMVYSKHRVIFNLTDERPYDVGNLSFQGFIVTVPDPGDGITFNTTVPYSNLTSTASGPATTTSSTTSSSSSSSSNLEATIKKISSIVGTIIFCLVVACCAWGCLSGCLSGCCSGSGGRRVSPKRRNFAASQPLPLQERWGNANDTALQSPPPPPYEPPTRTAPDTTSPFSLWGPTSPAPTPTPFTPPPVAPAPVFSPLTPFSPNKARSSLFSGTSTTPSEGKISREFSLSGSSSKPLAPMDTKDSHTSVYNPDIPTPANKPNNTTTTNPAAKPGRPQSPAWQDSSEALD
ncbi:hypothetical protein FRC19_007486 [Serendipita sp. 401]|nr:hypothetical protein FRC16_001249 [Serendipita sp. 398]KAG8821650.1 hypothetical protein FRC19_007486 [Serendipita sp. 401]KAG9040919.1 hypothetical protein FS842_002786 [Serendipita sp. 407]